MNFSPVARLLLAASVLFLLAAAGPPAGAEEKRSASASAYYLNATDSRGAWPANVELRLAWVRELGPGYSSPVALGNRVVMSFSQDESDWLAAFDAENGRELWRRRLGPRYKGHDGSEDGPLATPMVADGRVVAVSAQGSMLGVDLADGEVAWRRQLLAEGADAPFYGFSSSPMPLGSLAMIQAESEAGVLLIFDPRNGSTVRQFGAGKLTYQSPMHAKLAGQEQVLVSSDQWLESWHPEGRLLWRFQHKEGNGSNESAHPIVLDDSRVLLVLDQESVELVVDRDETGEGFKVSEGRRQQLFKQNDSMPVVHDGHIYGFTSRILNGVSADDLSLKWRTRAVSGNNLALAAGHLIQLTTKGDLVLARAIPEAFEEAARLKVLPAGDYGRATVSGRWIFVRGGDQLAGVEVVAAGESE